MERAAYPFRLAPAWRLRDLPSCITPFLAPPDRKRPLESRSFDVKLLGHRGHWTAPEEKNTLAALARSLNQGHGVETDIRDLDGELVISHDPPRRGVPTLESFLDVYLAAPTRPLLALNIKSDGLQAPLLETLNRRGVTNYFAFDMSLPDTLGYIARGMAVALRLSEYENEMNLEAPYIWLDAFHGTWYGGADIDRWLAAGYRVCVVSPELHRRPHREIWEILKPLSGHQNLYLCTDLIEEAQQTFHADKD